MLVEQVTGAF